RLTDILTEVDVMDAVRLHGHRTGAKSNFHTSSFSLLTSRFEGQPLVVLESMSAGCIPICYEVDYGPADIIDHGVNGFLVPISRLTDIRTGVDVMDAVRLHGHRTGAKSNFHTSSFSLLTSRFEGQPLVVLESMSAGCIPICYEVDYGPADIIDHGVNGFLVP